MAKGLVRIQPLIPAGLRLFSAGLQFLTTIIIARSLGNEGAALFFFWSALMMSTAIMACFGSDQLVLRDLPLKTSSESVQNYLAVIRTLTILSSFVVGLVLVLYGIVTDGFALWQLMIPIGMVAFNGALINGEILKGLSKPIQGVFFGHLVPVAIFCLMTILTVEEKDSIGLLCIYFLCFVVGCFAVRFCNESSLKRSLIGRPNPDLLKLVLKEGGAVFIGAATTSLAYIIPLAILKEQRADSEVSYVTTSYRLSLLMLILANGIYTVYYPRISQAADSRDWKSLFRIYRSAVLLALCTLILPVVFGILKPEFTMSIFGEDFRSGGATLRILLVSNLLILLMGPAVVLLMMVGMSKLIPRFGVIKLIIAVGLSMILIPKFGPVGMVVSMGIGILTEAILALISVLKKTLKSDTAIT